LHVSLRTDLSILVSAGLATNRSPIQGVHRTSKKCIVSESKEIAGAMHGAVKKKLQYFEVQDELVLSAKQTDVTATLLSANLSSN
jgi:hypothetical protein